MEWVETGELLMTGLWPGVRFPEMWWPGCPVCRLMPCSMLPVAVLARGGTCEWLVLPYCCKEPGYAVILTSYIFSYLLSAVMERGEKGPRLLAAMIPWMLEEPLSLLAESPGGSASSSGLLLPWTSLPQQCSSRVCMVLTQELLLISVN